MSIQEQKTTNNPKLKLLLDFIFQLAKGRPEWVGKYFENGGNSFDTDNISMVNVNSFNPDSQWLRGKNKKKFSKFILNQEIKDKDFFDTTTPKIFCGANDIDFQAWLQKYRDSHFQDPPKRWEVYRYLIDKYGKTHHFPGIDYLKYLSDEKKLLSSTDTNYQYYFLPGCLFYDKDGMLDMLSVSNHGNHTRPNFFDLDGNWGTSNEVILLKK